MKKEFFNPALYKLRQLSNPRSAHRLCSSLPMALPIIALQHKRARVLFGEIKLIV